MPVLLPRNYFVTLYACVASSMLLVGFSMSCQPFVNGLLVSLGFAALISCVYTVFASIMIDQTVGHLIGIMITSVLYGIMPFFATGLLYLAALTFHTGPSICPAQPELYAYLFTVCLFWPLAVAWRFILIECHI